MTSELASLSAEVWSAVRQKIQDAMQSGGSLESVEAFYPHRRFRVAGLPTYSLVVLRRSIEPEDWQANTGVAEQSVEFGITGTSYDPDQAGDELGAIAFALGDLFLADPTLGGKVRDVRVEVISPDAVPEGVEEVTQPWAIVRLAWEYEFLRP